MTKQDSGTRTVRVRSAFRQTGRTFLGRVLIIAVCVGAYYALNSMENTKNDFDKRQNAPIVIVDSAVSGSSSDIIQLTAAQLTTNQQITPYLNRVSHQPFKDGDELLASINQEILKDEAADERTFAQQLDVLERQYAARKASLFEKCPLRTVETAVPVAPAKPEKPTKPVVLKPCPLPKKSTCDQINAEFECWTNNYNAQKAIAAGHESKITKNREDKIKAVYTDLRPKLIARIENERSSYVITFLCLSISGEGPR